MPIEAASASTSVSHGVNGPRPMRNTVAWATATSVAAATAVVAVAASSPNIAPKTAEPSAAAATVRRGGNAPSVAGSTEMRSICTPSARASAGPGTNVFETASASVTPRTWPVRAGIVASSSSNVLLVWRVATGTLSASTVSVGSVDGSRRPPRTRIRAVHGTLRSSPASGISARSAVHAKVSAPSRSPG